MDPREVYDSVSSVLNNGNYSVIVLILGAMAIGRWWLKQFDDKNSREHMVTSEKIESTAAGLGRSIDGVREIVNIIKEQGIRTEEKVDDHISDHSRGEV